MSIIVAIKNSNGVTIGADQLIGTLLNDTSHTRKIFPMKYSNTLIGLCGYAVDLNILETISDIVNPSDVLAGTIIDKKYVINNIVPFLFKTFDVRNRMTTDDKGIKNFMSEFIFCTSNSIFTISSDGCVLEYDNYVAIGSGESECTGFLNTIDKYDELTIEQAESIVKTCITKSCMNVRSIGSDFDVLTLVK